MELVAALPAESLAGVDPAARGAAPLLRPRAVEDATAGTASPFALCLASLTGPPADGQLLPPAGKDLPLVPFDPVPFGLGAFGKPAAADPIQAAMLAVASSTLGAAGQPPELRFDAAPLAGGNLAASPSPVPAGQGGAAATLASRAGSLLTAPALTAPALTAPALAASTGLPADGTQWHSARAADAAARPFGSAVEVAEAVLASSSTDGLEALVARDARRPASPPPLANAQVEPAASQAPSAAASANPLATPVAVSGPEVRVRALGGLRREDAPPVPPATAVLVDAAAGADTTSALRTDWLPPAGAHTPAASAPGPAAPAPQTPVDTRTPSWQEAFTSRVQWLVDQRVGEARIKLNPPELGAVDVKISLTEDKTYVHLTTATSAARDELANSLPRLRELFVASGLELGGASVASGHAGRQEPGGYAAAEPRSADAAALAPVGRDERLPRGAAASVGRIDVFA
jgi:hypothetical protein